MCCGCKKNNEEETKYQDYGKSSFIDETINFSKAAETAYISDSFSGSEKNCYTIEELKGVYVSDKDSKYRGKVILTIKGENIEKAISLTDGEKFYVINANPLKINENDVYEYNANDWNSIRNNSTCN